MTAYYNEIEPYAAQWLRNLIDAGHIAPGVVDTRSIEDVRPSDLAGFRQCHFFAGIGVWSLALRRAGWPDDRPVWTGSCPCQPFSAAGKGVGFADERHLWPAFFHLIEQCRPPVVFGEQVASKDADPWIDLVCDDLEALEYGVGAVPFPSASVGAPHIRDRLFWVADAHGRTGREGGADFRRRVDGGNAQPRTGFGGGRVLSGLANASVERCNGKRLRIQPRRSLEGDSQAGRHREALRLADADGGQLGHSDLQRDELDRCESQDGGVLREASGGLGGEVRSGLDRPREADGFWRTADWLFCRDGRWRPVEPGTFPLAHGAPARVGRLRAYGNAINAEAARVFIESFLGR